MKSLLKMFTRKRRQTTADILLSEKPPIFSTDPDALKLMTALRDGADQLAYRIAPAGEPGAVMRKEIAHMFEAVALTVVLRRIEAVKRRKEIGLATPDVLNVESEAAAIQFAIAHFPTSGKPAGRLLSHDFTTAEGKQ